MQINFKICTECKKQKLFTEFTKSKLGKYGLRAKCKKCRAEYAIKYSLIVKDKISARGKEYRKKNAEKISVQRSKHTKANKERLAAYQALYTKNNPGKVNARTARRRAARNKATLNWMTKDQLKEIEALYVEAANLTKQTGIPHEVDHIIPLQGIEVRGLHVPWNLQIVERTVNRRKSRKWSGF